MSTNGSADTAISEAPLKISSDDYLTHSYKPTPAGSRLAGKTALITGPGSGIGFAILDTYLSEGCNCIALEFSAEHIERATKLLKSKGHNESSYQWIQGGDAADEATVAKSIKAAVDKFGQLDIAVLNAGIAIIKPFIDQTQEEFERITRLNQYGGKGPAIEVDCQADRKTVFMGMQLCVKQLLSQKTPGSIIVASSLAGLKASPGLSAYAMGKFAVRGLAMTVALEYGAQGIRVNAVCPGLIDTPMLDGFAAVGASKEMLKQSVSMGRFASPYECAKMYLFLGSDESSYCNGGYYTVGGGMRF